MGKKKNLGFEKEFRFISQCPDIISSKPYFNMNYISMVSMKLYIIVFYA